MSALELAGMFAAAEAERLWRLDIFDPPKGSKHSRAKECLAVIEDIIKQAGWGFATPYVGNGPPQWCGMLAAKCWRAAGINPSWFATYWASTYRLHLWARYKKFDAKHANPPPSGDDRRLLIPLAATPLVAPRAGDIVIVGDGEPDEGDHITIAMAYDEKTGAIDTISGNGGGAGPKGNKREGISRRTYTIGQKGYRPMWLVRPAFGDLLAERLPDDGD
jgi:hypothetical protein